MEIKLKKDKSANLQTGLNKETLENCSHCSFNGNKFRT